jgi:hypothetical protein
MGTWTAEQRREFRQRLLIHWETVGACILVGFLLFLAREYLGQFLIMPGLVTEAALREAAFDVGLIGIGVMLFMALAQVARAYYGAGRSDYPEALRSYVNTLYGRIPGAVSFDISPQDASAKEYIIRCYDNGFKELTFAVWQPSKVIEAWTVERELELATYIFEALEGDRASKETH